MWIFKSIFLILKGQIKSDFTVTAAYKHIYHIRQREIKKKISSSNQCQNQKWPRAVHMETWLEFFNCICVSFTLDWGFGDQKAGPRVNKSPLCLHVYNKHADFQNWWSHSLTSCTSSLVLVCGTITEPLKRLVY